MGAQTTACGRRQAPKRISLFSLGFFRNGAQIRTPSGLSDLCDIPELLLGQTERGRVMIQLENLLCLARALDVPLVEFISDYE